MLDNQNFHSLVWQSARVNFAEAVKGEAKEIPDMVKKWVEHYEKNQKAAMAELLTMLFEVSYFILI